MSIQDTNPIQTSILNQIGQYQTVVGIIGDQAQSIYGFQGAKPEQFKSFSLKNIKDYIMADNRRSTNQIIDCLNSIRNDIQQIKINNRIGEKPTIIIGNMVSALNKAIEISNNEPIYSLTRSNVASNALKNEVTNDIPSTNYLHKLYDIDSNSDRKRLLIACIKAIELSRQNQYKEAIKELDRIIHAKTDFPKKDALKHIVFLLGNYSNISNKKLIVLHSLIRTSIDPSISDLKKGAIKDFYESYTYDELAVRVNTSECTSVYRTIHKAKGAEFDNILVVIKDEKDLNFLLNPSLVSIEEHRIYYVALSRAKERLFITVPLLKDASKNKLSKLYNIVQL